MHCGRPIGDENSTLQKNKYKISNDIKASGNEWNFMPGREYCHDCIQKGYTKHSFIAQAKALYLYKGKIKKTMYRFKYNNKREYAAFFAQKAVEQYTTWMKRTGVQVIIPVPMYRSKKRQRGYNQAETFAKELARLWGIPCDATIVKRVINTTPQKGLGEKQRKNNLKNAFHVEENVVQYSCAMVVDDIYTTGSTAEAVARELIKRGTRQVYLLTICIGEEM